MASEHLVERGHALPRVRASLHNAVFAGIVLLALVIRLDSITAPPLDFAPARQTYDALRARIIYADGLQQLEPWKRAVLDDVRAQVPQIEPPVLEHLAAAGYRLAGSEQLWIARMLSVLLWIVGGAFLHRLATRVADEPGPLIALGLYLFMPFGIFGSRSFQPDPLMVTLTLAALVTIVRFHEHPSNARLAQSAVVSALAILSKPAIPVFFLWGAFAALGIGSQGFRRIFRSRSSLAFAVISLAPAALYYLYGTVVASFLGGHTSSSLRPSLLADPSFWRGWMGMVASVVAYPLDGLSGVFGLLTVAALAAVMLVGLLATHSRAGRSLLVGLWAGYIVFGVVFTEHVSTHVYYSLPLVPIVALSAAPAGVVLLQWLRTAHFATRIVVVLVGFAVLAGATWKVEQKLESPDYHRQVEIYKRIGVVVGHTSDAIHVDQSFDTPLLYYAWIASSPLYYPRRADVDSRLLEVRLREITARSGKPRFLIVTATQELNSGRSLRTFAQQYSLVAKTRRYAIFALSNGT